MSLCALCSMPLIGDFALCEVHHLACDDWAELNRLWCDLVHRGRLPAAVDEPAVKDAA